MNEIDFIGYSAVHPKEFCYDIPSGFDCYLLLLITSPAELLVDNEIQTVSANTAILYAPGSRIYYRAKGEEYRNDWIRFRSDESFVEQFPIKNTPFPVRDAEYCHNLFKLLTWESSFTSTNSETTISHLLWVLFSKLHETAAEELPSTHTQALVQLHKKICNQPQAPWNINQMAEELHLSTSRLQTLYKQMFGISCMDDVIKRRLYRAKDRLKYTTTPIHEIADDCGYNNVEHFCRQFRQYNGCTPSQFRKSSANQKEADLPTHLTLGGKEAASLSSEH